MELNESTRGNSEPTRSVLVIDLSQYCSAASSSETLTVNPDGVVKSFYNAFTLPAAAPAELPGDAEDSLCGSCGLPESDYDVIVCDSCERGFHVDCAGMLAAEAVRVDEWMCSECLKSRKRVNQWPFGRELKRTRRTVEQILKNDVPENDKDKGDEESTVCRTHIPGDNTFVAHPFGVSVASSSSLHVRNLGSTYCCIKTETRSSESASSEQKMDVPGGSVRTSETIGVGEVKGFPVTGHSKGQHSCILACEFVGESADIVEDMGTARKETSHNKSLGNDEGLPLQYADFFVLSIGKIDARPTYHCVDQIWPVGYRSCWHDKITGSFFISDVLDGGDSGPVFRVQRLSCSKFAPPMASTLLSETESDPSNCEKKIDGGVSSNSYNDYVEDDSVVSMLADPSLPMTDDLSSLLGVGSEEYIYSQMSNCIQCKASPFCGNYQNLLSDNSVLIEIGEILVEESSSTLAWRTMATKLLDSWRAIMFKTGVLKFICQHAADRSSSACSNAAKQNREGNYGSLTKFHGLSKHVNIPSIISDSRQFEILSTELLEWLGRDRLGLDTEFVQEIIEQLPGVVSCSHYILLNQRHSNSSEMVQNRLFNVKVVGAAEHEKDECGQFGGYREVAQMIESSMNDHRLPPGKPISTRLPPNLVGSVFRVWEFLWRFWEVLGLETSFPYENLEQELIGALPLKLGSITYRKCTNFSLTEVHISLLQVLIVELQMKVSAVVDAYHGNGDLKLKHNRKRKGDCWISAEVAKLGKLPLNALTWPELARRFALVILYMGGNLNFSNMTSDQSSTILRCLQGDGGVLCGSLSGITGIHADALLLAEATNKIFGSLSRDHDMMEIDDDGCGGNRSCENAALEVGVPKWAQVLEPVKKLPTNVGARIRNCVKEALEKRPPEWAREILEHSISKEVYKGNASGPTKRAVLSVLAQVCGEGSQHKHVTEKRRKKDVSISSIIMKQCQIVLREVAISDERKVFCNLLWRKLNDERILGSRAMVACPLDFRTIDFRLATGAYGGSHEAFREDVRQLWMNIRGAFYDQPDLFQLAEKLSSNFELLYVEKVDTLYRELLEYSRLDVLTAEATKKVESLNASAGEIPRAPWEEGVCRICGIDQDDNSVLLCDNCDADYHTYCLNPPLARIPEGNWYCPSCTAYKDMTEHAPAEPRITCQHEKDYHGKFTGSLLDLLYRLSTTMKGREYWELSVDEKTFLLQFLCNEMLDSTLIRQHLERCGEASNDLQWKFRRLSTEVKALKRKEEILAAKVGRAGGNLQKFGRDVTKNEESVAVLSNNDKCDGEQHKWGDRTTNTKSLSDGIPPFDGDRNWTISNIITRQSLVSSSEKIYSVNDQVLEPAYDAIAVSGDCQLSVNCHTSTLGCNCSFSLHDISALSGEKSCQDGICKHVEKGISNILCPEDLQGLNAPTHMSGYPLGNSLVPMNATKAQSEDLEFDSNRNEILLLQNLIKDLETQLEKFSLRGEFLGSDSAGRFYWIMVNPGLEPSVIVNENKLMQGGKMTPQGRQDLCSIRESASFGRNTRGTSECSDAPCPFVYEFNDGDSISSSWVCYQSDTEIKRIVDFLKDDDPRERQLRESISQWQELRSLDSLQPGKQHHEETHQSLFSIDDVLVSDCLMTKAACKLKVKYGYCVEPVAKSPFQGLSGKGKTVLDDRMYRCECLEPVWPSRHHCSFCHRTFSTKVDFKVHRCNKQRESLGARERKIDTDDALNGKNFMNFGTVQEGFKGKGISTMPGNESRCVSSLIQNQSGGLFFPFSFEDICSQFVIKSSNKELVKEIGLLGSNGIPSFVSSVSPYLSDPALEIDDSQEDARCHSFREQVDEPVDLSLENTTVSGGGLGNSSLNSLGSCLMDLGDMLKTDKLARENSKPKDENPLSHKCAQVDVRPCWVIPESSLRPLVGDAYQIFRRLKINLLDMEAALPEAALRSSKLQMERRWAWRDHVKCARTIYEMVQALILFEDSMKPEYLSDAWFYWSSLSAAAQTSTLSALSLRLYSLDAAIKYEQTSSKQLDAKVQNPQQQSSRDSTEKYNKGRKFYKKGKERES